MTKVELYSLLAILSFSFISFNLGVAQLKGHRPIQKDWKGKTATIREVTSFFEREEDRSIHKLVGVFLVLISLVAAVLYLVPATRGIVFCVLCGSCALLMLFFAVYYGVVVPLRCTQRVCADFLLLKHSLRLPYCYPVFGFEWNGHYCITTAYANIHFQNEFLQIDNLHPQYPIFINPRDPFEICTSRCGGTAIRCLTWFLIFLGLSVAFFLHPF
ncbi:MAG: hypothetical protein IIZ83_05215 [Oscillospiraceae bacterium]|nr:hypothetical protein [Oscillospiraceae bacterium]